MMKAKLLILVLLIGFSSLAQQTAPAKGVIGSFVTCKVVNFNEKLVNTKCGDKNRVVSRTHLNQDLKEGSVIYLAK